MAVGAIVGAVLFGLVSAVGALIAGHPFWLALAVYSGGGVLCALLLILRLTLRSTFEDLARGGSIQRQPGDDCLMGQKQTT